MLLHNERHDGCEAAQCLGSHLRLPSDCAKCVQLHSRPLLSVTSFGSVGESSSKSYAAIHWRTLYNPMVQSTGHLSSLHFEPYVTHFLP